MSLLTKYITRRSLPGTKFFAITPSDSVDLAVPTRGLYITTGGTLTFIGAEDTVAVSMTVASTTLLPFGVRRVLSTGTAATGIVGVV